MSPYISKLEYLPDEILLEVCRYLHSGDVLYSFFGLNTRLNRMITFYRQHISLHRTYYLQFVDIFQRILPQIEHSIESLVIFELESPLFFNLFSQNCQYKFLRKLTLVNWTDEKLISFVSQLHGMELFEKLVLQALDLTDLVDHRVVFQTLLQTNDNRLKELIFDHECDSLQLTDEKHFQFLHFDHLIHLNIELRTTSDLVQLISIVPNLEQLNVTFKHSWTKISFENQVFLHLKKFSVYAMSWFSTYDDMQSLVQLSKSLEYLSLVLVTHDRLLIDKQSIYSILPRDLQEFHYSVCYQPTDTDEEFSANDILEQWKTIPIEYSISLNDRRIFLHTKFYESARLSLRSLFSQQMSTIYPSEIYKNVRHLHVYDTMHLIETFGILRHCRKILDFIVSIRTLPVNRKTSTSQPISHLPRLNSLDFLSIQGSLPDLNLIDRILSSAPNLSAMSIDFDCLHKLLIDDEQTLLIYKLLSQRIIILCIRFEGTIQKQFTDEHLHSIARVFHRIHHMCIDFRNSTLVIESQLISLILNYFTRLMVLSIYGKLSDQDESLKNEQLPEYLVKHSSGRLKSIEHFRIDYGNERVKVWM